MLSQPQREMVCAPNIGILGVPPGPTAGAVKHKDTNVKVVCMCLKMPVWFDFAFPNLITLLSEAGFKFGPVHRLIPPAGRPRNTRC